MRTREEIKEAAIAQAKYEGATFCNAVSQMIIAEALLDIRDLLQAKSL